MYASEYVYVQHGESLINTSHMISYISINDNI